LQHMQSDAQLQMKQAVLLEQLQHFGDQRPLDVLPPLTGPTLGYRHKARLGVKHVVKKGRVLVGFREKRSPFVADIEHCPVLMPALGDLLPKLRELVTTLSVKERLPQVEVAAGDACVALVFRHLDPLTDDDLMQLRDFCQQHCCQTDNMQVYLQPKGEDSVHKLWPEQPFGRV